MEVHHKCRLVDLCRVCGCKLHRGVKAKGKAVKPEPSYSCISYADKLLVAFDINVAVDAAEIHPQKFCTLCFKAMSRVLVAKEQKNHVKCYVQLYNWHLHSASTCKGCKAFYSTRWHSSPQTIMTEMITPRAIIQVIEKLAPPAVITREPRPLLVASECPCCYTTSDLQPEDLKSAPDLVVKLLSDIAVQCPSCKKDVIARNYNTHKCSPQINTQSMIAAEVITQLFESTSSNTIQLQTGGTPFTVMKITQPRAPMNLISRRTKKRRIEEITKARAILSAGSPSIVLLETEPSNVEMLCSSVLKTAHTLGVFIPEVHEVYTKFHSILSKFGRCHSLYDSTVVTQWNVEQLGEAIRDFFTTLDNNFKGVRRSVKMHLLECHMQEWIGHHHAGCGLMGEQGAESIHSQFNSLGSIYKNIPDSLERLRCIMQDHYLKVSPRIKSASPPKPTRQKSV
eukprot:Em0005g297a